MSQEEIKISASEIMQMMAGMPEEIKDAFKSLLSKLSSRGPMNRIKDFVKNYSGDPIDELVAIIVAKMMTNIELAVREDVQKSEESGSTFYSAATAATLAVKKIREVANELEDNIEKVECKDYCGCKKKH